MCPHCDYFDQNYHEWAYDVIDSNEFAKQFDTITCQHCKKQFKIYKTKSTTWTMERIEK